jgi:hypothetical protein
MFYSSSSLRLGHLAVNSCLTARTLQGQATFHKAWRQRFGEGSCLYTMIVTHWLLWQKRPDTLIFTEDKALSSNPVPPQKTSAMKKIKQAEWGGACNQAKSFGVQGNLGLHSKFQASVGYIVKSCLEKNKLGMVAHTCNHSYPWSRDREDLGSKSPAAGKLK